MKSRVILKNPRHYVVEVNNELIDVTFSGKMHFAKQQIYVGDFVEINEETLQIEGLYPRNNFLIRPLVANVDQVLIVMSLKEPDFSSYLVDKFLTYCHYVNVEPIVILTKSDLVSENKEIEEILEHVKSQKSRVYVNDHTPKFFEMLKEILKGKVSVFMGQTGVGKSSLINSLFPHFEREVNEISKKLGRGKHTTKEIIMLRHEDYYLVDTPGFSSFILPMDAIAVSQNYPLIENYLGKCFFQDCLHLSEKDCKVKEDVAKGLISKTTYDNYVKIIEESKDFK